MRRREFIAMLGAAAVWPATARSQPRQSTKHVAIFTALAADDPEMLSRIAAFLQGMQELGWVVGRNLRIEYRFGAGDPRLITKYAAELAALSPDTVLATSGLLVEPLLQASRSVPIVFTAAADPVGAGYVASLSRPGGNATGFSVYEYGIGPKWLELLKQIAPSTQRVAVIRNASLAGGAQFGAIQAVAPSFNVELRPIDPSDPNMMERAITAFAREPNGGLIVTGSAIAQSHRDQIVALAAQCRLPAVYSSRFFVSIGGLLSYGVDTADQHRRAAGYVDRILKGEKPADLPVQAPTQYEFVVNLKTAMALGLTIPETLLATADEVIQ
jgi:putative tryptophan/tyrosine transport system substrate-binding protein